MRAETGESLELLAAQRERAERRLNGLRAIMLLLLASAALAYAPSLPPALNRVNVLVLTPTLGWTVAQWALFYRRPRLPGWLAVANPLVDVIAITATLGGYGLAHSPPLAFKSPIFLAYFAVLGSRPIASSTRKAAAAAVIVVLAYASLLTLFVVIGRAPPFASPVAASSGPGISALDEGAKLLLLAMGGLISVYATAWHEGMAMRYYQASRDREQLEIRLAQAQLSTLRQQLRPHFLFNTLNTITALISVDARSAERMVSGLSALLRLSLRSDDEQEVPLDREMEMLEHYLEIQRIRFRDRLTIDMRIDPGVRQALVPNLVLQPLVENAIRHGIGPRAAGGRVTIAATRRNGTLELRVEDDGVGPRAGGQSADGTGTGLANTRARLQHLYGPDHRFEAGSGTGGGFVVRLEIPLRIARGGAFAAPPATEDVDA
jgi:two-component sensor histidine kinase